MHSINNLTIFDIQRKIVYFIDVLNYYCLNRKHIVRPPFAIKVT